MQSMPPNAKQYLRPDVLAKINDLEWRARYVVSGFVSGMHASPYHGYSVEFAEHKEYVPGDDIRHLDWRVYAKSDRFYIKQFEAETNLSTYLLLDCSSSMRYPEQELARGRMTKFEYGATLAASLAYLLLSQQDAVGAVLFDDDIRAEVEAHSHRAHLKLIIAQLERARLERPGQGRAVFDRLAAKLPRRNIVVLISDLLSSSEEIVSVLAQLRHGGHEIVVMHVLDQDEREFPFTDQSLFEGIEAPELQAMVDPQSLRQGYLDALHRFIADIRAACTNAQIEYVGLSTSDPLDVALRSYLTSRSHRIKAKA